MKIVKPLAALALFVFVFVSARGQNEPPRCSADAYMQLQIQQNPSIVEVAKQQEAQIRHWIAHNGHGSRGVITIPVVVHLVYNPSANMTLSDWQVKSQIDVLNEDYRRQNADTYKTPAAFSGAATDCEIQFCLAKRDPNGNPTTGILREMYNDVTDWSMGGFNAYKVTAWPRDQYLNIWVAKLAEGVLGYSTFPSITDFTDGVVITDTAFGRIGELKGKYNRGRTATHEVGHWLDMIHIWGDDSPPTCDDTDNCDDTPNQFDSNSGVPEHPHVTCDNGGDMFMNYMDYVHDSVMNVFTADQKTRMLAALTVSRASILSSQACNAPWTSDYDLEITSIINPSGTLYDRYINPNVRVTNRGAEAVGGFRLYYRFNEQDVHSYDWTGSLLPGDDEVIVLPQIRDSLGYNFFIAYAKDVVNGNNALVVESDTVNNFMSRSYYVSFDSPPPPVGNVAVWYDFGKSSFDLVFDLLVYDKFDLSVFNSIGQRVSVNVTDKELNKLNVDMKNAVPGPYFLRVVNGGETIGKAVVIIPAQ
jgi:hypothetical protein